MRTNLSSQITLNRVSAKYYKPENELERSALTRNERITTDIYESAEEGSAVVASEVARLIRQRQAEGKDCVIGLVGGSTPSELYAQLVRTLKDQYQNNPSKVTAAQIANLRKRLYLTRAMQVSGIGSLLLCVVSMFFIYIHLHPISVYIFGLALLLLILSLTLSVYEILISVKALELHLKDME